jgi:predicted RNA methylase
MSCEILRDIEACKAFENSIREMAEQTIAQFGSGEVTVIKRCPSSDRRADYGTAGR